MKSKKSISFILLFILAITPLFSIGVSAEDSNLALGKTYTLAFDSPVANGFPDLLPADDASKPKLTDGKKCGAAVAASDSAWLRLYRGTNITITVDLGAVYSVNAVSLGQLQISAAGIDVSRYIYAAVSEDGQKFGTVGSLLDEKSITETAIKRFERKITFDKYYKARYVRVIIGCDVFTYNDELEVWGSTDSGLGISAAADAEKTYANAFPTDIDGLKNIVLMYSSEYYKGVVSDIGKNTYDELTPYFAYVDSSFKPVDTMFDGMLFLPLNPLNSSNNGTENFSFAKKEGWQFYLYSVIGKTDNVNLTALNTLVGDYKTKLGLTADYKYPVYISVPFIEISNTVVFGDIDGELVIPSDFENRIKIVKWFVDNIISSFEEAGLTNIQLNGFYWQNELVPYTDSEFEDDLIVAYNEYVHSKEYSSIWIPYYCAPGFDTWKELGFDAAVLQNGYAFYENENAQSGAKKEGVVDDALAQSKKYGLGMEIETSGLLGSGETEAYNRLFKYIRSAYTSGLMENGLAMYYQGGGPGTLFTCAKSKTATARAAYDMVYNYIKKNLSSAPVIEKDQFIIVKKGEKISGKINVTDKDTAAGLLTICNKPSAANVNVSVKGTLIIVNASGDFTGEDSFKVQISDGFNTSVEETVKVYVVEDLLSIKKENSELKDNSANIYNQAGSTTGTDSSAYEVVVNAQGKIVSVGGYNNTVPEGGYVIAAKGEAQQYLKNYAAVDVSALYEAITDSFTVLGQSIQVNSGETSTQDSGTGTLIWVIIGAFVLVAVGIGAYIIIKAKLKKGAIQP